MTGGEGGGVNLAFLQTAYKAFELRKDTVAAQSLGWELEVFGERQLQWCKVLLVEYFHGIIRSIVIK